MLFFYTLLFLILTAAAIFAAPLRSKAWTALGLVSVGALWGVIRASLVLAGGGVPLLWSVGGTLFGGDTGSMDPLSAFFVIIISVGSVAATLYSRGYLAHTLPAKSPAHVSLHYASLTVMCYAMLGVVSCVGLLLTLGAILAPEVAVNLPVFNGAAGFGLVNVPVNAALLVLCGLCTSVMWGGIFNLAVEGLGKYTEKASGIFMALVCGGGILPLLQNAIVDMRGGVGYLASYWVIVVALVYMLYYALVGSKNVNKDIPVND